MKRVIITVIALSTLIGCKQEIEDEKVEVTTYPVLVKTTKIEFQNDKEELKYSGTIEAGTTIPLTFQNGGTIAAVYIHEGDYVKKGQLLAKVDKRNMQNAVNSAQAQYDRALDAKNRLESVYIAGSLAEIKWVEIESKVKQAESNLNICKKNLDNCEMRTPTNGYIGKRNIEVGASAIKLTSAIDIVKIDKVFANISVPENEIKFFEKGQEAKVQVHAVNNHSFIGKVKHINVVADPISRTYNVKIELNNKDTQIKPGMVCNVETQKLNTTKILVPITSISKSSGGKAFVYIVDKQTNKAIKREVVIGGILNNQIIVRSGLNPGDILITSGIQKMENGELVKF